MDFNTAINWVSSQDGNAAQAIKGELSNVQNQVQVLQSQLAQLQQQLHNQPAIPSAAKAERPQSFKGQVNGAILDNFIWACDVYFDVVGLQDPNTRAKMASTFLVEDAAIWFRSRNFDLHTMVWDQLKQELTRQFKPVDYVRRARDQLAELVQTGSVQQYINTFRKVLVQVPDCSQAEAVDRFTRGLKPFIRQKVLVENSQTFESAVLVAERVGSVNVRGNISHSTTPGGGSTPMELGNMAGTPQAGRPKGNNKDKVCYYCKKQGHFKKECPLRKGKIPKNGGQGQ